MENNQVAAPEKSGRWKSVAVFVAIGLGGLGLLQSCGGSPSSSSPDNLVCADEFDRFGQITTHCWEDDRQVSNQVDDSRVFRNCDEARAVDAAPVRRGDPGYGSHLDRDGDGVGCEPWYGK
ncbi:MAG: excalibur calcium-binding domain-containing protein [Leucobacter sp.]